MKASQILVGLVVLLLAAAVLVGGCTYKGYNQSVNLDEAVKAQWAQVENQLQRRYDLIPNLEETVKGVSAQERKIFLGIAEARKSYFQAVNSNAPVGEKAEKATQVEGALARLLVLQETYPQLKSNESFMKLQDTLEGTENRVAVERGRYNDTVKTLNAYIRTFPNQFFASLAGVSQAKYFEPPKEAQENPKVDFSDKPEKEKS